MSIEFSMKSFTTLRTGFAACNECASKQAYPLSVMSTFLIYFIATIIAKFINIYIYISKIK